MDIMSFAPWCSRKEVGQIMVPPLLEKETETQKSQVQLLGMARQGVKLRLSGLKASTPQSSPEACYGLNYILPKFICSSPKLQCDYLEKGSLGGN